jgi:tRNA threonylcarbamoyl adenosine modification protein YjeE
MTRYLAKTEDDTAAAAREIARSLPPDAVVHLVGDLGAGKTFMARVMAAELGADPREVASPSFAIVHEYPRPNGPPIIHIDGYRLSESRREWLEIGIPELLAPRRWIARDHAIVDSTAFTSHVSPFFVTTYASCDVHSSTIMNTFVLSALTKMYVNAIGCTSPS